MTQLHPWPLEMWGDPNAAGNHVALPRQDRTAHASIPIPRGRTSSSVKRVPVQRRICGGGLILSLARLITYRIGMAGSFTDCTNAAVPSIEALSTTINSQAISGGTATADSALNVSRRSATRLCEQMMIETAGVKRAKRKGLSAEG